jgi:ribonuclease HI
MTLRASIDGASRGNPGEAGVGVLVTDEHGATVLSLHGYIGVTTNNVAEYSALIALLNRIKPGTCTALEVQSDSELLVRQIRGKYRVRDQNLRSYFERARHLMESAGYAVNLRHVPRDQNREADRLANLGIERKERIEL